ncbi:MAG: hypothetical protein SFW36_16995 [Leptolyngbyaceae cyanobacterium bins.59]|nr:hypothetical protein [Leptolyngbyaceae cyanobacterium bins.59]
MRIHQTIQGFSPFSYQYLLQELAFYRFQGHYENSGLEVSVQPLSAKDNLHDFLNLHPRQSFLPVPVLYREHWQWMSLKPAEIQSMWLPLQRAQGKVATAGLGLGYYALRAAAKPEVERVDVYEIDPRVIRFFEKTFSDRAECSKIHIIQGDVHQKLVDRTYDFCFLDFYGAPFPVQYLKDLSFFLERNQFGYCHIWYEERIVQELWLKRCDLKLRSDESALLWMWQEYLLTEGFSLKPRLPELLVEGYSKIRNYEGGVGRVRSQQSQQVTHRMEQFEGRC